MANPFRQPEPTFPSTNKGPVFLAAGLVVLALAADVIMVEVLVGGDGRPWGEVYEYKVFVRMRNPGDRASLLVPVPDFPELRDRASVNATIAAGFPNENVTQSIVDSPYGSMYRFTFSDSFFVWGQLGLAPDSAKGTLAFSGQVSNTIWVYLSNTSPANEVSVILSYEITQLRGFLSDPRVSFVSTLDPRGGLEGTPALPCGVVYRMAYDGQGYTVLSSGWRAYSVIEGGYAEHCPLD